MKNNFNILRFIFASVVVIRHIIDLSQHPKLIPLAPLFDSYLCITGFFIISGFLVWKSYSQTNSISAYFEKRARRLLPAYIFFVLFATISLSLLSSLSIKDYFLSTDTYKYVFFNLIFLNFIKPCLPGLFDANFQCAVNGALWTIKVEVLFYLTVPLIYKLINNSSKKYIYLLILYAFSVFIKTYLESLGGKYTILARQMPGFLSYFASGISFFYYADFYTKNRYSLLITSLLVTILEHYIGIEIFTPFGYSMLIYFLAYNVKLFNNFGKEYDLSYGIYIYHFTTIQILVQGNYFNTYNPLLVTVLVLLLVLSASFLSWNYLERPYLKRSIAVAYKRTD